MNVVVQQQSVGNGMMLTPLLGFLNVHAGGPKTGWKVRVSPKNPFRQFSIRTLVRV
jgi:hypothetical protein